MWVSRNRRTALPPDAATSSSDVPTLWSNVVDGTGLASTDAAFGIEGRARQGRSQRALREFRFQQAILKPDAAPVIAQVTKLMADNPGLKLEIDEHTDNIGNHDYNVTVGKSRRGRGCGYRGTGGSRPTGSMRSASVRTSPSRITPAKTAVPETAASDR